MELDGATPTPDALRRDVPLVSLCLPTYNGAAYLPEAIASALAQTYPAIEIVLSDDGSTDDTVAIARASATRSAVPFTILTHDRYGMAGNWNACIGAARGQYVKFLFQDDLLAPECVAQMVALAERDAAIGMVFCRREVAFSDDTTLDDLYLDITRHWSELREVQSGLELLADPQLLDPPLNKFGEPTAVLVRREAFDRVGLFDPDLVQVLDLDMWLRLAAHYKIGYVDAPLASFRVHQHQASHHNARSGAAALDTWRLWLKLLGDAAYADLPPELRDRLARQCADRLVQIHRDTETLRSQFLETCRELEAVHARHAATREELARSEAERWQLKGELELAVARWQQAQTTIAAMESSKFWKLRNGWLKLRRSLGLGEGE